MILKCNGYISRCHELIVEQSLWLIDIDHWTMRCSWQCEFKSNSIDFSRPWWSI